MTKSKGINATRFTPTPTELQFLAEHFPNTQTQVLADVFGVRYGQISGLAQRMGWKKSEAFLSGKHGGRLDGTQGSACRFTKGYKPRKRYVTDSHLRRIKLAGLYGNNGKRTPSGLMFCCVVELLYLTGADVSVMVRLLEQADQARPDEPHVCADGIMLRRDKTDGSSRPVIIEWTPRLRAVVARLTAIKAERRSKKRMAQRVECPHLITKVDGTPMNYEAFSNQWQKAMKRAAATGKVPPTMTRDLRAKAATDKDDDEGLQAANHLLDHTTQAQTMIMPPSSCRRCAEPSLARSWPIALGCR